MILIEQSNAIKKIFTTKLSLFPILLSNIKLNIAPHLVLPLLTLQECKTIFHLNALKGIQSKC